MESIIYKAAMNCSMRHCKDIPRGQYLWDEQKTLKQKVEDIEKELKAIGYRLMKITPFKDELELSEVEEQSRNTMEDGE